MDNTSIKSSNPQSGIFSIRYRDSKGRFTKAISRANSFQYVLKNGVLSDKIVIPRELKKAFDKHLFVKETLSKIYQAEYDRRRKQQDKRAKKAKEEGRKYTPKPIAELEEAVGISKEERRQLERRGVKVKSEDTIYRVPTKELTKRRKKAQKFLKELLEEGIATHSLPPIIPTTKGSATPRDKKGRLLKDKKGKEIDWYKHQLAVGMIGEDNTDSSIMLNMVRRVAKFIKTDFKSYKDTMLHAFPQANRVIIRVGAVTDIEEHADYLYGESKLQVLKDGEWEYVTSANKRKNTVESTEDFTKGISANNKVLSKFKEKFPDFKFRLSEDDLFSFEVDARNGIRNLADSISFRAATNLVKLLNKDFDSDDEHQGRLTSSEIFTKVKLAEESHLKKKLQHFIVYPFITMKFTRIKKEDE